MKNTHSTLQKLLLLAIAPAFAVACSPKEVPRVSHENGIPTSPVVYAPKGEKPDPKQFSALDVKGLQTQHAGGASLEVLSKLEPYMLFATYIESPHYSGDAKTREMMRLWNRALVKSMATNPNEVASKKFFERTLTMMLSGCNEELKGCLNVRFFSQDAESSAILTTAAKQVDQRLTSVAKTDKPQRDQLVKDYYRYLLLAFDMRNRVADQELEFLYMNRAADYAALDDTQLKPALISRHAEVFEMILLRFNPDLSNPQFRERFQGFIDNFQPWTYSRRKANLFGVGATKILSLAATNFLYKQDGQLSDSLRAAIDDSQKINDASEEAADPSFAETVKYLKDKQPRLWANLKLKDDFNRDEYFFLIDRLFRDHLTPDDVSAIWSGARADKNGPTKAKRILAVAESYIKIELARMIAATNAYMNKSYKNKKSNATLLRDTIEQSYTLSTQWNQLLSKIDRLGIFLSRQLKLVETSDLMKPGSSAAANRMCVASDGTDEQAYRQFEKNLTSLRRNIKYFSVYPNMMAMVFFLEEADFKISIYTFFGAYELDAADIIFLFFQGNLRPFFNFGNNDEALQRLETLYAFYFALKTDTFQAFTSGDRVLDEELFFEKVIGKYLAGVRKGLEDSTTSMSEKFKSSTTYSQFLENCEQDRKLLAEKKAPGDGGLTIGLSLEKEFADATYMGSGYLGLTNTAYEFYGDYAVASVGRVRKELRQRLNFVEAMVGILKSHLEQVEPDAAKRDAKIQRILTNLNKIEKTKRELLTEAYRRHQEVSSCLTQTMKIEFDRQAQLIRKEEQHLRDVYREIQALKGLQGAELANKEADLNRRMREKYPLTLPGDQLPDGFNGFGQVFAGEYQYAELDVRLRMRSYLAGIAPNMRISLPTNLADSDIYKQRRSMPLSGRLSEDLFVLQGLRALGKGSGAYVNWTSKTSTMAPLKGRLSMISELHKLGPFEVHDHAHPSCAGSKDVTTCPLKVVNVSADEVVDALGETIDLVSLTKNGQKTPYAQALELTGSTTQFARSDLEGMFFDKQGRPLTFAEWLYNSFVFDNEDLKEAKEYYMTESGTGHFLFAPDKSVSRSLRARFRPLVLNYFSSVDGLKEAIERREQKDAAPNARRWELGYELRPGAEPLVIGAPLDPSNGNKPVYLNPSRSRDFVARKNLFTRETNNEFRPKPGDVDFDPKQHKADAEAECK